ALGLTGCPQNRSECERIDQIRALTITDSQLFARHPFFFAVERQQMHLLDELISETAHCTGIHPKSASERSRNSFEEFKSTQTEFACLTAEFPQTQTGANLQTHFVQKFEFPPIRMPE